jgi:prepilin-type N-terminal cleavage/methylation domain-containing protein
MATSQSLRKLRAQQGFTLVETMVAIVVLVVGLVSVAALMSQMVSNSSRSRYMSTAAVLASEKLEDLNRYPANDPNVAPGGALGGAVAGYSDAVTISLGNGALSETVNGVTYTNLPNGTVTNTAVPAAEATDIVTFNRSWVIENGQPIAGVRRITVQVAMLNNPAVTFTNSTVRP